MKRWPLCIFSEVTFCEENLPRKPFLGDPGNKW